MLLTESILAGGCFVTLYALYYRISSVKRRSSFPFQNNPKNLDLSYKTGLDLCDCLGRVPNNPKNLDPFYKMDLDLCDCLGRVKLLL